MTQQLISYGVTIAVAGITVYYIAWFINGRSEQ